MKETGLPSNFTEFQDRFADMFAAFRKGSELARHSGPLDAKTTQLVQMAAAIGIRSEGAVHSHARRALEEGASVEDLYHVVNLTVSTLGFPTAAAAFSWVRDVLKDRGL